MSEQGWRGFLAAEGLDDWVVLHGGATAVFRVGSVREAARLAEAIAEVPGLDGSGALLTIADGRLTVRLTRDLWQLESRHVELARAISAVARAHGAVADRAAVQEVQLAIAAKPDASTSASGARCSATRRWPTTTPSIRSGTDRRSGCRSSTRPSRLRHAMHVDVSVAREQAEARLAAAVAAGGRIVDESTEHWTLADRAGNRVDITAWPDGATRSAL